MKLGSLFTGGGLGDFGFMAAGMEITWQCEIDEYCQKILELRYPESKKYRDIKTLKGSELEPVDIVTGGFPCQPFSVAGKQRGKDDNRYLWPEMFRIIRECRPRWIIGENVPGIINLALTDVCIDLETQGYEVWPMVFPSHALGAWHKRDRLWIICHAEHFGRSATKDQGSTDQGSTDQGNDNSATGKIKTGKLERSSEQYAPLADTDNGSRIMRRNGEFPKTPQDERRWDNNGRRTPEYEPRKWWKTEPSVGRVANGITDRIHRLKMLGNGQVPACTYVIGKMIMEIENDIRNQ